MEVYGILAAGYGDWPVIKQIAWLLGKLMNIIFNLLSMIGLGNIGIAIIIFTFVIYTLMIPITIKQQKTTKLQAVMQPEIKKIQKKYENKKDNDSMMKQQEELNHVYEKYGTSATSGCLPLLIQMPILFALYPVIRDIPSYVTKVKDVYTPLVEAIMATDGYQAIMETIGSASPIAMSASSYDYTSADTLVSVLYKFQDSTWQTLTEQIPSVSELANSTMVQVSRMNSFLGINIAETPWSMLVASVKTLSIVGIILAVIIPLLAGGMQFLSVKLSTAANPAATEGNDAMSNSMKQMNYTMPLMSVFFAFTLPAGLGLYWAASAVVRCIQQWAVNKYMARISVDDLVKQAQEKAKKKREKKGESSEKVKRMATTSTRNVGANSHGKSGIAEKEREEKLQKARELSQNAKEGSLASKANMVARYNSGQVTGEKPKPKEKEPEKKEKKKGLFGRKKEEKTEEKKDEKKEEKKK